MQKVLRKRILRDLRENKFRYLALAVLIIMSMYLVISLVGAAETIMQGGEKSDREHRVEDGEFSVFVPLTTSERKELTGKGVELQESFYMDYEMKDNSILRLFENREKINLAVIRNGRKAESSDEVMLEQRYCEEHGIKVGGYCDDRRGEAYRDRYRMRSGLQCTVSQSVGQHCRKQAVWPCFCNGRKV